MSRKEFLVIAFATLITVILWAILDTLHTRRESEIPQEWVEAAEPLNPNFDVGGL